MSHSSPERGRDEQRRRKSTRPAELELPEALLASREYPRLFPSLARSQFSFPGTSETERHAALHDTVRRLLDDPGTRDTGAESGALPAGYTYFGQFVVHDLTFFVPTVPLALGGPAGSGALAEHAREHPGYNERTPRLDLDSVYGGGPLVRPELYRREQRAEFLLGGSRDSLRTRTCRLADRACDPLSEHTEVDLPRTSEGLAIIPDWRNDENTMLGQLHLGILRAHNERVRQHREADPQAGEFVLFQRARRDVVRLYQWVVLHDWLPRLLDDDALAQLEQLRDHGTGQATGHGLRHAQPGPDFAIPREFVFAAGRFGHSLVRFSYALNGTGAGVRAVFPPIWSAPPSAHLMSRGELPDHWTIDWRLFLDVPSALTETWPALRAPVGVDSVPQMARPITPRVMEGFASLPPEMPPHSLPELTLRRDVDHVRLPAGQDVARHIEADVIDGPELPLWVYILEEARQQHGGRRLGNVGSTIVAETLLGTLLSEPDSLLRGSRAWTPAEVGLGDDAVLAELLLLDPAAHPQS